MLPDEALELQEREPMPLHDPATAISDRHLENVLCQIHCDGIKVHLGLLLARYMFDNNIDTVTRGRTKIKRLAYLSIPSSSAPIKNE